MQTRRSYSGATARAALRVEAEVRREERRTHPPKSSAMSVASVAAGGASDSTINRWKKRSMSEQAINQRLSKRGRHSYFTEEEKLLLLGYLVHRRQDLARVDRSVLIDFCKNYFHKKPRPQLISETLKNYPVSSQKVLLRSTRMTSIEVVDDGMKTIQEIREESWAPDEIIVMDETGAWTNNAHNRTYHYRGWYEKARNLSIDLQFEVNCPFGRSSALIGPKCYSFFFVSFSFNHP
jgi:hypothetical protein